MEPGFPLVECPDFELMSEHPELASCQKICKLRCGCWHPAGDLVASDAGEHDAISLRGHASSELTASFGRTTTTRAGSCRKVVAVKLEFEDFLLANINVAASAAAPFFHFGEVGAFVPVGFGVVVVGDGIEALGFGGAVGDDGVRHADDGGGVHAAAKFGENGAVRTEPAADSFGEDGSEMLFVFGVGAVTDSLGWI